MQNIDEIIRNMSLKEKVVLTEGKGFWETRSFEKYGIGSVFLCDGPHGLRRQENKKGDVYGMHNSRPATCFPAEVTVASSWDPDLAKEIGEAIADEAKSMGVSMVLGPGVNIKRNPLCGRNFEYFSEDPYLSGKMAAGFISGAEGKGVASCIKHFAANSQEKNRLTSDGIVDERTLREIYLRAFEIAVTEAHPSAVMSAYPKLNGIHCSDHRWLLTDVLRKEWGFDGFVVTDWGGLNDRVAAIKAGCDLAMPGNSRYMEREVIRAVRKGDLPESTLDESAKRILSFVSRAEKNRENVPLKEEEDHLLSRRAASSGAVLLKNEDGLLPFREGEDIAVIGAMAKQCRFQGSGSSHIQPTLVTEPLDELPGKRFHEGYDELGNVTESALEEACSAARSAKAAVVFIGLPAAYEWEGFDRDDMKLPEGMIRVTEAVAEANPNTVVVLFAGAPVECPFADHVKAILYMGLPGQAAGEAVADLLYGRVNPSGKLAETWPLRYEDCISSSYYLKTKDALYREGIYVGYRYYDKTEKAVRYPFGYGLSYTTFSLSDLSVNGRTVSLRVRNTGNSYGAEVVQLYVKAPADGIHRPVRELRKFRKVFLNPGEEKTVSFELEERDFQVYQNGWKTPRGNYVIEIGTSLRDILLSYETEIEGEPVPVPKYQASSWYETLSGIPTVEDLEQLTGRRYAPRLFRKGEFTMDHTMEEMKEVSGVIRLIRRAFILAIRKKLKVKKEGQEDPALRMSLMSGDTMPLRALQINSGIRGGLFKGVLEIANGHVLKGFLKMIFG